MTDELINENSSLQSRRTVLKAGLAGVVAAGAIAAKAEAAKDETPKMNTSGRMNGPVFFDVETTNGAVRGIANGNIKLFRGIPYGADTGGKNRFMPPKKP